MKRILENTLLSVIDYYEPSLQSMNFKIVDFYPEDAGIDADTIATQLTKIYH